MRRFLADRRGWLLPLLVAGLCLRTVGDVAAAARPQSMAFAATMPRTVVWAWEEPEDLRAADPAEVGVAYLAETLLLDSGGMHVRPRHQPLQVAQGAAVMAVVRVQTGAGFHDSTQARTQVAEELAGVARHRGVRALQVDFDATRRERVFYAAVLEELRAQMPKGMPLSMTALASWCAEDPAESWLAGLPVDEAVAMDFRLGGRTKPWADKKELAVREPLCGASVGISTDESWPQRAGPGQRMYLFSPQPWQAGQLAAVAALGIDRPAALKVREDAAAGINDTGLRPSAPRAGPGGIGKDEVRR